MELTRRHSGIRVAPGRKAFVIINTVVLLLISAIMLYPAIYVIAASFSEETAILRGDVFLYPVRAHLKAYQKVFVYPMLWKSYSNTLLYTVLGTAINLILTVFGAWALSQKKMVGRRFFTLMCTFTMFFGGGMIPTFLVVKGLGLLNTIWGILLPGAVSTYNMILMRTFFRQIPESLVEAAELDGCKDFGVLFRILLPLNAPASIPVTLNFLLLMVTVAGTLTDFLFAAFFSATVPAVLLPAFLMILYVLPPDLCSVPAAVAAASAFFSSAAALASAASAFFRAASAAFRASSAACLSSAAFF